MHLLVRAAIVFATASSMTILATPSASAEPDTRFGSCREMRSVDANGVASTQRAVTRAQRMGFRAPLLCPVAYGANRRLDTDRDGVACERKR